jgi:serine/threonine protein kinase
MFSPTFVLGRMVCVGQFLHRLGETAAIATEYVEGESLRQILIRYSPISIRKGLGWTTQICDALREAHAQGVVHRDLKPENIVIDRDGNVKVMGFGIARSIEATTATSGAIVGTPAYMCPEKAQGRPADARSHLYSLGLVLYEMFHRHNLAEVIRRGVLPCCHLCQSIPHLRICGTEWHRRRT